MKTDIQPIFIISLPRSGSTLLQRIIASNQAVHTTSEPWFLLPLFYSYKKYGLVAEYSHRACFNAINDFVKELPDGEKDYLQSIGVGVRNLYQKVSPEGAIYFVDKTPRYYLIINELAKAFTDGKFIFLFRNPLDVLSSILNTWSNNSLRLEKNYVDLTFGPKKIVEGFKNLEDRSISLKYEELLKNPEKQIISICNYLGLEFESNMINDFSRIELKGEKGDPTGTIKYDRIVNENTKKWKRNIYSNYRKKFAKKFIKEIGIQNLSIMGYNYDEMYKEIENIDVSPFRLDVGSRIQSLICDIFRIFDYQPFRVKLERRLLTKDKFQRYS